VKFSKFFKWLALEDGTPGEIILGGLRLL